MTNQMNHKLHQALQYCKYLIRCIKQKQVSSVFIQQLIEDVFKEKAKFYAFDEIEALRAKLLLTEKVIKVNDLGAGSKSTSKSRRKINQIAKTAIKAPKNSQVLYRLVHKFKPKQILELGTSFGITTSYLAKATKKATITTIEGSAEIAKIAQVNFSKLNIKNISQIIGNFDHTLDDVIDSTSDLDFVFFDGNHRKEPTLRYFLNCLEKVNKNSIFVFDDIYWSAEMTNAWIEIKKHTKVAFTIDCFEMGIVFFDENKGNGHFTVYH